ncbi:MAG: Crp/Fnr family transcriptional regulator [Chlorogloeopsis fritschii C42_A2020_084]|uniref:Crp/Fnr family transcriptional regulator n=1 Tax=Chlorogloeopsis fritschii TaxID=1124 RepID=UPI0019E41F67|nr:Crp/Fnr family transcriptional regulator [Chlorogloeopsis fritschii]MBF2006919.1 Crp/Fnr family transcriptional regulator [Chlorogloeopsis fritschii C42_A2020_084]
MLNSSEPQRSKNFILNSLPQDEYDRLHPHLERVELHQNEVLSRIREPIAHVYFPTTVLLSLVHSTMEGETVEVGATGFEGMEGTTFLFNQNSAPWQVEVQLAGEAFKLSTEIFVSVLQKSDVLRQKVTDFTYFKLIQLTQSALCNRFHTVEQRLCRWLLAAQDRVKTPELLLTRDVLATMIGSTRPAVSIVTGTLQTAGLIRATRGKVTILNREEMEEATCECYQIIKQEFARYLQQN